MNTPNTPEKKEPYGYRDHSHCWTSKTPPCGQKIEHLKCCLCEMVNPKCKMIQTEPLQPEKKEPHTIPTSGVKKMMQDIVSNWNTTVTDAIADSEPSKPLGWEPTYEIDIWEDEFERYRDTDDCMHEEKKRYVRNLLARHHTQTIEVLEGMKNTHELDMEVYHNSGGGRMCARCGKPGYEDDKEPCDPDERNQALDQAITALHQLEK